MYKNHLYIIDALHKLTKLIFDKSFIEILTINLHKKELIICYRSHFCIGLKCR